jgi:hypothetical protein
MNDQSHTNSRGLHALELRQQGKSFAWEEAAIFELKRKQWLEG